jgi:hypothetical protein
MKTGQEEAKKQAGEVKDQINKIEQILSAIYKDKIPEIKP